MSSVVMFRRSKSTSCTFLRQQKDWMGGSRKLPVFLAFSTVIYADKVGTYATIIFLEIPSCADHVIFVTEFVFLSTNPPIYEVNQLI